MTMNSLAWVYGTSPLRGSSMPGNGRKKEVIGNRGDMVWAFDSTADRAMGVHRHEGLQEAANGSQKTAAGECQRIRGCRRTFKVPGSLTFQQDFGRSGWLMSVQRSKSCRSPPWTGPGRGGPRNLPARALDPPKGSPPTPANTPKHANGAGFGVLFILGVTF